MILDLHERLTAIGIEPVPYQGSGWDRLRDALPDRDVRKRSRVSVLVARPLIAASMVVGLSGAAAAASPAVREQVITTWHRIERVFGGGGSDPTTPGPARIAEGSPDAVRDAEPIRNLGWRKLRRRELGSGERWRAAATAAATPAATAAATLRGTPVEADVPGDPGGATRRERRGNSGGNGGGNSGGNGGGNSGGNGGGNSGGNGGGNSGGNGGGNSGGNGGGQRRWQRRRQPGSADRSAERSPERSAERSSERSAERIPERSTYRSPERSGSGGGTGTGTGTRKAHAIVIACRRS